MTTTSRFATFLALAGIADFGALSANAETVVVKYRGPVDLAHMRCEAITRSSFIQGLCYDAKGKNVVVRLDAMSRRAAESMGRYDNANTKGRFDCRQGHVPEY